MVVCVNIRYRKLQESWASSLLSDPPPKNGVKPKSIQDEIAASLSFLSGATYSAEDVFLEFDEGNVLDRPETDMRIRVQSSGALAENQVMAALDRIVALLRKRLPRAELSVQLQVGHCSVARLSSPALVRKSRE